MLAVLSSFAPIVEMLTSHGAFVATPAASQRPATLRSASSLRVRAAAGASPPAASSPPKRWPEEVAPPGVPLPPQRPSKKAPLFGFVDFAEVTNSRAAMLGFFALLALEGVRLALRAPRGLPRLRWPHVSCPAGDTHRAAGAAGRGDRQRH